MSKILPDLLNTHWFSMMQEFGSPLYFLTTGDPKDKGTWFTFGYVVEESKSGIERAARCSDAMRGIADPAAYVKAVEELMAWADSARDTSDYENVRQGLRRAMDHLEAAKEGK